MPRFRPSAAAAAALTAGAALGILAPLLETAEGPVGRVVHLTLAAGWCYAAFAFCVGLTRTSAIESALMAPTALIAAVIAYYSTKLAQGAFLMADFDAPSQGAHVNWTEFLSRTVFWALVAVVLGAVLGLAGNVARKRGMRGLLCRTLIPLVVVVETSQRLRFEAALQGGAAGTTWHVTRLVAVAVLVYLVGLAVMRYRSQSPRPQGDSGAS